MHTCNILHACTHPHTHAPFTHNCSSHLATNVSSISASDKVRLNVYVEIRNIDVPVLLVLSHLTCTSTYYTFTEVVANAGRKVSYISGSVLLHEHENSMQSLPGDSILVYENLLPTVQCTLFGGRSPACSHICKSVRLPPSGIGFDSAICVYKRRTKQ